MLEEKDDIERLGVLDSTAGDYSWKIRSYEQWNSNDCDERFGQEWPGQIPPQLVGQTLYFFTREGDLVFDPMAGGGVVPDVCLAMNT